jgi:hypothetical protein
VKSVSELVAATKLTPKEILTAAKVLVNHDIVTQTKKNGGTAYEKDPTLAANVGKILSLAAHPDKRAQVPTKVNPPPRRASLQVVSLPKALVSARFITLDDIDSFAAARDLKAADRVQISEAKFKSGVQSIVGETGSFKDWGGERNDLWTSRLRLNGKRRRCAVAFKGPGTTGKLTPKKLGKNGDQIQRLFKSDADVYLVQYWAQIDESVVEQMTAFAQAKSAVEAREITYGVIDGDDSARLMAAYPKHFS